VCRLEVELVQLERAEIKGYRSLREVTVPFARLTSCIGPNGSGKSSLLGALRIFFDPSATADERDYWSGGGDSVEEISIRLTFSDLADEERTAFEAFLDDANQLVVERRFERGGSAVYLGSRLAIPQFLTIRMLDRAHRTKFNELADSGSFEGLETATSKDEAFMKMDAWESAHPDRCEVLEVEFDLIDDLIAQVNFLSIDAFEDPSEHVGTQGKGAVAQLLAKIIDHRSVQDELDVITKEATERSEELLQETSDGFSEFAVSMEGQLTRFAPGFNLKVKWASATIQGAKPRLELSIETADGLNRPLEYQGHGVQRALMYAALTAQVEAGSNAASDQVLLAIEEPEAFQHPLSCRVLSGTLRELSRRDYQIIYSTHSPYFIHPELVNGLRIFRRESPTDDGAETLVESLDETRLLEEWHRVFEVEDATITSVLARLERHLPPQVLEGLFARLCILVEGPEDEAVIRSAALLSDLDLDAAGMAVIQTNGKPGMPNVLAFLSLAGIHIYPVFDLDRQHNEADQNREAEAQILRALGVDGEPQAGIHAVYACWEQNMTERLRADLGEAYEESLTQAAGASGYSADRGRKVPAVVADLLKRAADIGAESETVRDLGTRMSELMEALPQRPLAAQPSQDE
jgi:putative ATP-dependent endonuclease of OLD family